MKFWKTLFRSVLEAYGLIGRFIADKIDGGEVRLMAKCGLNAKRMSERMPQQNEARH